PAVRLVDGYGNPCPGIAVAFRVTAGGGSVSVPNAITNDSGIARSGRWTLGSTKGINDLSASATNLPTQKFRATAGMSSPDISIAWNTPGFNAFVEDSTPVDVAIKSAYSLAS